MPSLSERKAAGKKLREKTPRSSHAGWKRPVRRADPIDLLRASDEGRLTQLLPIRYERMSHSPLSFLRGAAAIMAADLAPTPVTGLRVQACGDAHLMNFGEFATPERRLVFDVNDFDETLPGPWEWDVKRLAASFTVAGRTLGFSEDDSRNAAYEVGRSYREHMSEYAEMSHLDVWHARIDSKTLVKMKADAESRKRWEKTAAQARQHTVEHAFPKLAKVVNGQAGILDEPPLVYHPKGRDRFRENALCMLEAYRKTLIEDRRFLLSHYEVADVAMKVVGVGSVGTRCAVVLLMASENDPLLLQVKEARPSVLEPHAGKTPYRNQGERVVSGQRLMQAASDMFLGWGRSEEGHDFYFRQLRDMKCSPKLKGMFPSDLAGYAEVCGWALARAHAKSGDAAAISGYLGKNDSFDAALREFSTAYADQTERDFLTMRTAIKRGRLKRFVQRP